jgi:heat-inducible transcriptional repressor
VVVLSNGAVEKHSLELGIEVSDTQLAAASAHIASYLIGYPLGATVVIPPSGDTVVDGLTGQVGAALEGSHDHDVDTVFVGGAARMAVAFDAVDTIRRVLSILEKQYVIVTLLQDVLDRGLTVAIGTEHGVQPLAECSVVVAPYEVEGEPAGTVGVLGPTRMRYEQALAAVAVVSHRLGRALTEG